MGEVIQLRESPTKAQLDRVRSWASGELAQPTRRDDKSLCEDLAHLAGQIEAAAILLDAKPPRFAQEGDGDEKDEIFRRLYRGAVDLMLKACNCPDNQIAQSARKAQKRKKL